MKERPNIIVFMTQIPDLIISRSPRLPVRHHFQALLASQDSLSFPSNDTLSLRG